MPNNISPGSATQATINTMDTTPTNTTMLKPLGDLSVFPREIRDEIYRHVFPSSKRYRAFYSASICRPAIRQEWVGSDLSILRLSKAIKDEAISLLYSEGTFCFRDCVNPDYIHALRHPNADVIDRMTNIELFHDAIYVPEWEMLAATKPYCAGAGPLEFFQGASVMRKSIHISLEIFDGAWLNYATAMAVWRPFKVLRHLIGFQTVTLRLIAICTSFPRPQGSAGNKLKESQPPRRWAKLYRGLDTSLSAMSKDLEPTLGNRSAMSELVPGPDGFWYSGQRHVTFHPRDHLVSISKEKKETMEMKNSKGTKWIKQPNLTKSIPG